MNVHILLHEDSVPRERHTHTHEHITPRHGRHTRSDVWGQAPAASAQGNLAVVNSISGKQAAQVNKNNGQLRSAQSMKGFAVLYGTGYSLIRNSL